MTYDNIFRQRLEDDTKELAETLHDFRQFVILNTTQWKMGAHWSGQPMWKRVAEVLDKHNCNDDIYENHGYIRYDPEYYCE
jgi:hypothetical protein